MLTLNTLKSRVLTVHITITISVLPNPLNFQIHLMFNAVPKIHQIHFVIKLIQSYNAPLVLALTLKITIKTAQDNPNKDVA